MPKPKKYREVLKLLRARGIGFTEHKRRGKGSHRTIQLDSGPFYPLKCHGNNTEIPVGTLAAMIRVLDLPKDIFD